MVTGTDAAYAITLALLAREKTNKGQYIDISMLDVGLSLRENMSRYDMGTIERSMTDGPDRPFLTRDNDFNNYRRTVEESLYGTRSYRIAS